MKDDETELDFIEDETEELPQRRKVIAAPALRRRAAEDGIDLTEIHGTGERGAITKVDYEAFAETKTAKSTGPRERQDRLEDPRYPLHHLAGDTRLMEQSTEKEIQIGDMKFTRIRTGLDHSMRKTVDIPSECLNNELNYRIVVDDRGKLQRARNIGYQRIDKLVHPLTGEEIPTSYRMGTNKDGSEQIAYLMATPKKWKQERDAAAEKSRRIHEDGLFEKPQDESGNLPENEFYKKGSNLRR